MIPVNLNDARIVEVSKSKYRDYYNTEIAYLRNNSVKKELIGKIDNIFKVLKDKKNIDYHFFERLCCNFQLLEEKCREWNNQK